MFDEEVTGGNAVFWNSFAIYNAAGTPSTAINAAIQSDGKSVVAQFLPGTVSGATLATVRENAVQDAGGNGNYAVGAALTGSSVTAGTTSAPDLRAVGNSRTTAVGEQVIDFTFDEALLCTDPGTASVPGIGGGPCSTVPDVNPDLLQLVLNDGSVFRGLYTTAISANHQTVSVVFGATTTSGLILPNVPFTQVDRGVAEAGAVSDPSANLNSLQAVEVSAGVLNPSGGTTDGADLLSARVAGSNSVEFTFDEPVDAISVNAAGFGIVSSGGVQTAGSSATRSSTNSRLVTVTFPAGTVGGAVLANIDDGVDNAVLGGPAVQDTVAPVTFGNNDDSVPLQNVGTQAGRTALPDLVSVKKIQNQFGDWLVTYQFDQALTAADVDDVVFALVDTNGNIVSAPLGANIIDPTDTTKVRISTNAATVGPGVPAGFTNAQVAGAMVGSVYDSSYPALVEVTEGAGVISTGI